jgi:recombination protein RecT
MATPTTTKTGQIVPRSGNGNAPPQSLAQMVQKLSPEIARALPRHVNPDRMARIVTTALRTVPQLADCTPASFLGCVIQCAQLGLEPCTPLGHAYLIPFKNKKRGTLECTLIIGYKGMIELARRSGMVTNVYAYAVREGDDFRYQLGTKRMVHHVPSEDADRERKRITHVYSVAQVKNGEPEFQVLTRAQVEARRARSRASQVGPWVTDYEPMALKTAVRALAPWMPQSAEFAHAVSLDEAADRGGQLAELDEETKSALLSTGIAARGELEAAGEEVPDAPAEFDSETGEVREPGSDDE